MDVVILGKNRIELHLTKTEKQIIVLLIKLLEGARLNRGLLSNYPSDEVPLSNEESSELLKLLDKLRLSRKYMQKTYFLDNILGSNDDDDNLKEIYLSIRESYGRSRVWSSTDWADFRQRLGVKRSSYPAARCNPMERGQFLQRERQLFTNIEIPRPLLDILIGYISSEWDTIEAQRTQNIKAVKIKSAKIVPNIIDKIQISNAPEPSFCLSKINMYAALTLLANGAVMFTTRDWSVTGTISGITGTCLTLKK